MLSKNLKKYRKIKGFNQKDLSERSGVSFSMVSKLETGEQSNPTLETLNKLAHALDIETFKLLEIDDWISEIGQIMKDDILRDRRSIDCYTNEELINELSRRIKSVGDECGEESSRKENKIN